MIQLARNQGEKRYSLEGYSETIRGSPLRVRHSPIKLILIGGYTRVFYSRYVYRLVIQIVKTEVFAKIIFREFKGFKMRGSTPTDRRA